jgi:homogentisate 1,2-dioxygenase
VPIAKINVFEEAKGITQPFEVVDLADIDDFAARLFVSEGVVAWHKHIDQEQLFLVVDGELTLESEWGNNTLRSGEMAVIPKAVTHRCGSVVRTIALVFERKFFSNRQNGQRRLFVLRGAGRISPVNISAEALQLRKPCVALELTTVDDLSMSLVRYEGESEEHICAGGSELLFLQEDNLNLETDLGTVVLGRGEMTVVPKGARYRAVAPEKAVVLRATKKISHRA